MAQTSKNVQFGPEKRIGYRVHLAPKQGYRDHKIFKDFRNMVEAVKFMQRAVGYKDGSDKRGFKKRPRSRNPWWYVHVTHRDSYKTILSLFFNYES